MIQLFSAAKCHVTPSWVEKDRATGAALIENNEASAKLTTANGGTFTWAQLDSVANHVTARSIGDWRALTWLATATGWTRRKCSTVVSLSVSTWSDTTWKGGTASRLYMCKSVDRELEKFDWTVCRSAAGVRVYTKWLTEQTINCKCRFYFVIFLSMSIMASLFTSVLCRLLHCFITANR